MMFFFIIIIVVGIYLMVNKSSNASALGFIYLFAGVLGFAFLLCDRVEAAMAILWIIMIMLIVQLGTVAFLGTIDLSQGVKIY